MEETKSKKGFNHAMIALILFASSFILNFFGVSKISEFLKLVVGMLCLIGILVGIVGLINSIKGLREPNSMEQIVGITVNGIFGFILIWVIIEMVMRLT